MNNHHQHLVVPVQESSLPPQPSTKPPWEGGKIRRVDGHLLGCSEWYTWYQCQICKCWFDLKTTPGFHTTDDVVFCRECHARRMAGRIYGGLVVPDIYAGAKITDYPDRTANIMAAWPSGLCRFLFLTGGPGAGKTHGCYAIQRRLSAQKPPLIPRVLNLPQARTMWSEAKVNRENLIHGWKKHPALIMDDLSATSATDGWKEAVHLILDERLRESRPTIVTAACGLEEIERRFDPAIKSRLSMFHLHDLGNRDRRNRRSK